MAAGDQCPVCKCVAANAIDKESFRVLVARALCAILNTGIPITPAIIDPPKQLVVLDIADLGNNTLVALSPQTVYTHWLRVNNDTDGGVYISVSGIGTIASAQFYVAPGESKELFNVGGATLTSSGTWIGYASTNVPTLGQVTLEGA